MIIKKDSYDSGKADSSEIVTWDKKYSTGIELIDVQHRELVRLANQLHQACLAGGDKVSATFKDAMSRMVEYVRFHFGAELQLLLRINYPDYQTHKKQHETLIASILDAAKDYNDGKQFVPNAFVRTLKDWVFGHIAVYDKGYALYVADQKRKGLLTDDQINGKVSG